MAARPEAARLGLAALQKTPGRLDYRPVEVIVAGAALVFFGRDEQLAAQGVSGAFDHGRDGDRRLLPEEGVPAGEQAHQSTLSTKMWMIPPHVRPTPNASSSEMP